MRYAVTGNWRLCGRPLRFSRMALLGSELPDHGDAVRAGQFASFWPWETTATSRCSARLSRPGFLAPQVAPRPGRARSRPLVRGTDRQRTVTTRDWDLLSPEAPVMLSV